ncbi:MAG: hypothetical protein ACRDPC_21750 [Solirubrobacteraceae bacterium]
MRPDPFDPRREPFAPRPDLFLARGQLRLASDARPIPASATGAVGGEAAAALPSGFVATTCTRSRRPRSSWPGTYPASVAPGMSTQPARRSRCHR